MRQERPFLPTLFHFDTTGAISGWDADVTNEHPLLKRRLFENALLLPGAKNISISFSDRPDLILKPEDVKATRYFYFEKERLFTSIDNATTLSVSEFPYLFFSFLDLEENTARLIVSRVRHTPYINLQVISAGHNALNGNLEINSQTWNPCAQRRNGMSLEPIVQAISGRQKLVVMKET